MRTFNSIINRNTFKGILSLSTTLGKKQVCFVAMLFVFFGCQEPQKGIKAQYRDLTEAVYSTVTVQPRNSYKVYPKVGGIIEEVLIEEGKSVKEGDLLLKITDNTSGMNVRNAELKYEIAKETFHGESAQLKEIEELINSAKTRVLNDSINYQRQKRLWEQNIGSKLELDNRKVAYDLSRNEWNRLVNSYDRAKKDLERQMEIAGNTLQISKSNNKDSKVFAKMDGMVYSLAVEVGEAVTPQSVIAVIGSESDFILTLLIDEVDISKVFLEQQVILSLDAYPDEVFEAKISMIYPEKDERSLTFKVDAEFVTKPKRLFKGLSGEANIVINQKDNVLTLPSEFISEENMVNTDQGLIKVTTGSKSLEYTEIMGGIDSSTVIKNLE